MKWTTLKKTELKKRCFKVFESEWYDIYTDCGVNDNGDFFVEMEDKRDGKADERVPFKFIIDNMQTERPTAFAYLMGERDDFCD